VALFFQRNIILEVPQELEECFAAQCQREIETFVIAFPVAFQSISE
jgi:hypothetical protein